MKKIYINTNYSKSFINNYLIKIIRSNLIRKLAEPKYLPMNNYLESNYKLSLRELVELVCNNLKINKYANDYIVHLNRVIKYNDTRLEVLADLVDFGNTSIQGVNLFNRTLKEVEENVDSYYSYLFMKGELDNVG